MTDPGDVGADLTLLGHEHNGPVDHVETFPAPDGCTRVVFSTDEVTSLCPVTHQPDVSSVRISYVPAARCIESKSLKLFLWGFRDRHIFAEALAVEIADEVWETVRPEIGRGRGHPARPRRDRHRDPLLPSPLTIHRFWHHVVRSPTDDRGTRTVGALLLAPRRAVADRGSWDQNGWGVASGTTSCGR